MLHWRRLLQRWWNHEGRSAAIGRGRPLIRKRPRLELEQLETRLAPAVIQWANNISGDFNTGANWVGGVVPAAGDDAVINFAGVTVTSSNNNTVLRISCTGTFAINGGTFTIDSTSTTSSFNLTGGALAGAGTLTVSSAMTWGNATMSGTGATTLSVGATLTISSGVTLDARTLNNSGTINMTGLNNSWNFANSAVFNNQSGGVFNSQNDQSIFVGSGSPLIANAGTFAKTAGLGTTTVNVALNNTGSVQTQSGTLALQGGGTGSGVYSATGGAVLEFNGGNFSLNTGSTVSGAGTIRFSTGGTTTINDGYAVGGITQITNGTVNFSSALAMTTAGLAFTGGTLAGTGNLSLTGTGT